MKRYALIYIYADGPRGSGKAGPSLCWTWYPSPAAGIKDLKKTYALTRAETPEVIAGVIVNADEGVALRTLGSVVGLDKSGAVAAEYLRAYGYPVKK